MRYLAIADISTIDPDIKATVYTLEIQESTRSLLLPVIGKRVYICPTWNILWHIRRIKRKRITNIGILMHVVSSHLPYPRNRSLIKF